MWGGSRGESGPPRGSGPEPEDAMADMVEVTPEALAQLVKELGEEGNGGKAARLFFEGFG